ncbi:hypothetical protein ACI2KR_07715 [Pseudomonas luteola]
MTKTIKSAFLVGLLLSGLGVSVSALALDDSNGATFTGSDVMVSSMTEDQKKRKLAEVLRGGRPLTLHNFVSGQSETISDPLALSKEKAKEYLPPIDEIQSIFDIYAQDNPAYAALIKTFTDIQESLSLDRSSP